jgi:hypothetical protein
MSWPAGHRHAGRRDAGPYGHRSAGRARRAPSLLVLVALALSACAPATRARRLFAAERFATPATPTGELARVEVDSGWKGVAAAPYAPPIAFERDGVEWIGPVDVTDRGAIEVAPLRPDAELRIYARHEGLLPRDFRPVLARSGTLSRRLVTALRFEPAGPLGDEPVRLAMTDLQDVYNPEPIEDGDLVLLEVSAPGAATERYLLRARDFGLVLRGGAGLLVPVPIPWFESQRDVTISPALAVSLMVGYRYRTPSPTVRWLGDQLALVGSIGIGSTVLDDPTSLLDDQLAGAFNAALVGGGVEVFRFANVQVLANASAPFRDDLEAGWTLAVGFDAVQFARFSRAAGARLLQEHPLAEDARVRAE